MSRHRRVAPQPAALRGTVKPVHGVTTRAVSKPRKPLDIIGEGTMTPERGGPHMLHGRYRLHSLHEGVREGSARGETRAMSWVFVLDTEHRPLAPVHPGHARRLLARGQAAVWRHAPFTLIRTRAVPDARPHPLRLKLDPGSRTTGLALVTETSVLGGGSAAREGRVAWAGELSHRGHIVHERLVARAAVRSSRRQRWCRGPTPFPAPRYGGAVSDQRYHRSQRFLPPPSGVGLRADDLMKARWSGCPNASSRQCCSA